MSKYSTLFYRIYHAISRLIADTRWTSKKEISDEQKDKIAEILASGYYVITTGRSNHLSSVAVRILTFFKTGKWPKYTHVLMNCDNIEDPGDRDEFKFIEAQKVGVEYSTFDQVFKCDDVCILTPKNISNEEWTKIIDKLILSVGIPYDDLFDMMDDTRMSCVEVVYDALVGSVTIEEKFPDLVRMMTEEGGYLTPQMYRDSVDFDVVFEK